MTTDRPPDSSPVLVITGMHRSGTSYSASLLQAAGLYLGDRLLVGDATNPPGFFEDWDFLDFHMRLLESHGYNKHGFVSEINIVPESAFRRQAEDLAAAKRKSKQPWGWKDPRTVLLLNFWNSILPDAYYLFVFRPPWDVVDSLFRRGDSEFDHNPAFALRCWNVYNKAIRDFALAHPGRTLVRELSQLIETPQETIDAIRSQFDIPLTRGETTFKPDLLTPAAQSRAAFLAAFAPESVALLADLRALARSAPPAAEALGCSSDTAALEHGLTEWHRSRRQTLTIQHADSQLNAVRAESRALADRLAQAEQQGVNLQHDNAKCTARLAECEQITVTLQSLVQEASQTASRLEDEGVARAEALQQATVELEAARQDLRRLASEMTQRAATIDQLRADKAHQLHAKEQVDAQLDVTRQDLARLASELTQRDSTLEELQADKTRQAIALDQTKALLVAAQQEIDRLAADVIHRDSTIDELLADKTSREADCQRATTLLEHAQNDCDRLTAEATARDSSLSDLRSELAEARSALKRAGDELIAARLDGEFFDAEQERLITQARAAEAELKNAHILTQRLNSEIIAREDEIRTLHQEMNGLNELLSLKESRLAELNSESEAKSVAIDQLHSELANAHKLTDNLNSEATTREERLMSLQADLDSMSAQRNQTQASLNAAKRDADGYARSIEIGSKRVAELTSFVRAANARCDSLTASLTEANDKNALLTRELMERDDRVRMLHEESADSRSWGRSMESRVIDLQRMVEEMNASTSWRVTKPMRWSGEFVRRLLGRRPAARKPSDGPLALPSRRETMASWLHSYGSLARDRLGSPRRAWRSLTRALQLVPQIGIRGVLRRVDTARRQRPRSPWTSSTSQSFAASRPNATNNQRAARPSDVHRRVAGETRPCLSVIVPTFNTPSQVLRRMLQSVVAQTYTDWEMCIVDDGSSSAAVAEIVLEYATRDNRITFRKRETNGGISVATNEALTLSSGDYVAFLDHDDELDSEALERCVEALLDGDADAVYTDQDTVDAHGNRLHVFYKPDWSPEYLRHVMYVGHLLVVRRSLAVRIGGFDKQFDGVQDYEFMLRLAEHTHKISHIPQVLYHWRAVPGSLALATDAKDNISELQSQAVQGHLNRLGLGAVATPHPQFPHRCSISPRLARFPKVSIVIPTKDQPEHIGKCLDSIFSHSTYPNFEVVVVDTGTTDQRALDILRRHDIRLVHFTSPFNYSAANNLGARTAAGDVLVFLNNDTVVITPDWLEHLVFHVSASDVGAAGPMLLYPNDTVQHAGVVLGARGTADHVMRHFPGCADGYAGSLSCPHEVSAVTGACLAIRREVFESVGGFQELYGTHYQDVDLCLRLTLASYRCIFTPDARLYHHESPSRGSRYDILDRLLLIDTWHELLASGDPYYQRAFSIDKLDYSLCENRQDANHASAT